MQHWQSWVFGMVCIQGKPERGMNITSQGTRARHVFETLKKWTRSEKMFLQARMRDSPSREASWIQDADQLAWDGRLQVEFKNWNEQIKRHF